MNLRDEAKRAILDYNGEKAEKVAGKWIEQGREPLKLIQEGFIPAMEEVGDLFDAEEIYLPEVMAAATAMQEAVELLEPHMKERAGEEESLGKIIICTIQGDIHSIGKNIVKTLLNIEGFYMIDLGKDVSLPDLVNKIKSENPDIVGTSALMTTTMPNQERLENLLREAGVRDKVKTMVGGAITTETWADEIGADSWGENAQDAVKKAKKLVRLNRQ